MKYTNHPVFEIGESAKVKTGTTHPLLEDFNITGWQGRVTKDYCKECAIKEECDSRRVLVEFDSITLMQMPSKFIKRCIGEGINYASTEMETDEIELAAPRDTIEQTRTAVKTLNKKYNYVEKPSGNISLFEAMLKKAGFKNLTDEIPLLLKPEFLKSLTKKSLEDLVRILAESLTAQINVVNKLKKTQGKTNDKLKSLTKLKKNNLN
jgi:hypothetical protein